MPRQDTTPRLLVSLLVLGILAALLLIACAPTIAGGARTRGQAELLAQGAELYAFHCSTCHGATGLGLEEARLHFPPDHAYCERCHNPLNPTRMTIQQMQANQTAFAIGDPPPLTDAERMARFGTAGNLYRYLQAAMPRWNPGSLTDEGYLAVTAHLLHGVGLLPGGAGIDLATLDAIPLRPAAP